jgi:hypothetical protein
VLEQALRQLGSSAGPSSQNGTQAGSLFDRLSRHGLIGCLDAGPEDLSTNPDHMEGFGERDR